MRKLAQELDTVNRRAKQAVLYYRTADSLKQLGLTGAVPSATSWINDVTEQVITQTKSHPPAAVMSFERWGSAGAGNNDEVDRLVCRSGGSA
ncbi:MAG: hypothetical protein R3F37_02400 [Candidatus Competibacteraceae bacterium]